MAWFGAASLKGTENLSAMGVDEVTFQFADVMALPAQPQPPQTESKQA
ncbi:MAG: hypothetical protein WAV85_13435 [Rhodoferax sp.]